MDLSAANKLREMIAELRSDLTKTAFLPMPGDMPQQMQPQPQGDPAQMQQGAPPQGAPPQGGQPPMDPAMMQGQPPMDPSQMQQGAPPQPQAGNPDMAQVIDQLVQGLEEMFGIVQELGQAMQQLQAQHTQTEQKIDVIVRALDQPAPAPAGMGAPQGMSMDPSMQQDMSTDPSMMQQGPPPGAEQMAHGMMQ